jgi:hypothetical protein
MLPRVKIYFENGNLSLVAPSDDSLMGFICTGTAVAGTFALATAYQLFKLADLTALGVTQGNNPSVYKIISEFYAQAGDGTEVWLMAFTDTVKLSDMVDSTVATYGCKLVDAAGGRLRGLIISRTPAVGYTPTIANGLDADVALAMTNGEAFANYYATQKFAPLFIIIEGYAYSGVATDLTDLTTLSYNHVSILIGDTVANSKNAAVGVIGGRLAGCPVQRNIARVRDGALAPTKTYIGATETELADPTPLNDKGYITFRTFVNQSGYYFNDDFTATKPTDDYCHLTARRTIDKAYRIAYNTLLQWLLDEVQVNEDGTLPFAVVKDWQNQVETAIALNMTAKGELSGNVSTGDKGVECYIDASQNVVSTSTLQVRIRVRPFGYPRFIDVYLGFTVTNS